MCFLAAKSSTCTTPCATFVSVVVHVPETSHLGPRTVAAEYWPLVLKRPLPSPHSLRVLGLLAAAVAEDLLAFGQPVSFSVSVSVVRPSAWVIFNTPS